MGVMHFHKLAIRDIGRPTRDSVIITFEIPEELKTEFQYLAGQYLTIRHTIGGESLRRSYSICTAPSENQVSIAVKQIEGGRFSTFANHDLRIGDKLEVLPPAGNFTIKHVIRNYVFFAAGSGITPIMAQIKHLLFQHPSTHITLIYGNRNVASIIFREELESLKNKYMDRLAIHHIFTREKVGIPLLFGRIDKKKCMDMCKFLIDVHTADAFLLCGPNEMIFDVKEALSELNVPAEKIHFELFNTDGIQSNNPAVNALTETEKEKECDVTIQIDGDIFEFSLAYGGQNMLDAAIACGADLPYACKGGVCSTCKAKITEGDVIMDLNYALEPDELNAGYVLLCQTHPRSPQVYVDFDQK